MDGEIEYLIAFSVNDAAGRGMAISLANMAKCEDVTHRSRDPKIRALHLCDDLRAVLAGFDEDVVFFDFIEEFRDVKYFVILSRHSSLTGMPTLTTHVPGNPWGKNDFGGKPWEIPPANPVLMWYFLKGLINRLARDGLLEFRVSYEVTHHGPTSITRPITFIEIGSSEREWNMLNVQRAVASVVIEGIENTLDGGSTKLCTVSIGFGGPHYAPLFTRRAIEYGECYGHIIPNYVIKELDLDRIKFITVRAIESTPGVERIVIEKVKSEIRKAIATIAEERNIEVISY
uniref:D-aminoacyl-tRNA deacylase n=1 Tax=Ignisphaera aggregans TaxID=334771 RepID=A0A7J3IA12_9CREN